jgi:6-phosphogluconolactonase (cycloisomerase 2 family)
MKHPLQLAIAGIAFAAAALAQNSNTAGAVFIMNNSPERNEVIQYGRAANGMLQQVGAFPTGGRGSGGLTDPLESQGSLVLSADHSMLFAVNAGSGDISVFRVFPFFGLELVGLVPSGGSSPVAIAQWGNLVYVLNSSGSSNVTGFQVDQFGSLSQIPNSTTFLTTNTSGAASIAFSGDGKWLAVTERLTNDIDVFGVQANGTLTPIVTSMSAVPGLFAVLFAQDDIAVAVSTGPTGATNGSLLSSYSIDANGQITPITSSVPTLGAASCWSAATPDGRFIYTSNAGTSNISGFALSAGGTLTALPGTVVASNPAGSTNLDIAVSADGKFLYSLNSGTGVIGIFAIQDNGALTSVGTASGFTPTSGFNGIAAY